MAETVLHRIITDIENIKQTVSNGSVDYVIVEDCLRTCDLNLERIKPEISMQKYQSMKDPINLLLSSSAIGQQQTEGDLSISSDDAINRTSTSNVNTEPEDLSFRTAQIRTGRKGRPAAAVTQGQIESLHQQGFKAAEIGRCLKVSSSLVYKKIKMRSKYTAITDNSLSEKVTELHRQFPNSGQTMMSGYLRDKGVIVTRNRVRQSLSAVDPVGTAVRWGRTIVRRTYKVEAPNSLWHMDAHMKLVRWGFVIHGCIDGYSRCITHLKATTSNKATEVLSLFLESTTKYGVPSRIRSDHGCENILVALTMNLLRGSTRGSHITGRSVHNERIERLWRDVFTAVVQPYYELFYKFEEDGILEKDSDYHKCAIQYVYLNEVNQRLSDFQNGWNNHKVRTEHHKTPRQLWLSGMLANYSSQNDSVREVFQDDNAIAYLAQRAIDQYDLTEETDNSGLQSESQSDSQSRFCLCLTNEQCEELDMELALHEDNRAKFFKCAELIESFFA